jgi:hypothetical protein
MALGELIEDESGKITGHRVLGIEGPKIERSFTMTGKYKPVMYAEAQGVMTSKDGDGMATYVAQGIGRFTSPGKIRFHGSVFFQTTSTSGSLIFISKIF